MQDDDAVLSGISRQGYKRACLPDGRSASGRGSRRPSPLPDPGAAATILPMRISLVNPAGIPAGNIGKRHAMVYPKVRYQVRRAALAVSVVTNQVFAREVRLK